MSLKKNDPIGYLFIGPAVLLVGLFGILPIIYTLFVSMTKWRIEFKNFLFMDNFLRALGSWGNLLLLALLVTFAIFAFRYSSKNKEKLAEADTQSKLVSKLVNLGLILVFILGVIFILPRFWIDGDSKVMDSLKATIWYSIGTVPTQLISGLLLAVLLDRKFKFKQGFRVIYLLPYIVPSVASAAVFERMFSARTESLANSFATSLGFKPLDWLQEPEGILTLAAGIGEQLPETMAGYWTGWLAGPSLALVSVMIFNWWVFTGYYALIYANGLSQIPKQLYEAARIDGAGRWTILRRITIPLLSPSTYFLTMLGIIGTFKAFNHIYVLRTPGARDAIDTMSINIFFTFFRRQSFGYAAALSLLLLGIVIALTVVQRKILESRVHYGD
jgi:multiple sugar transport system permease protein